MLRLAESAPLPTLQVRAKRRRKFDKPARSDLHTAANKQRQRLSRSCSAASLLQVCALNKASSFAVSTINSSLCRTGAQPLESDNPRTPQFPKYKYHRERPQIALQTDGSPSVTATQISSALIESQVRPMPRLGHAVQPSTCHGPPP